MTGDPLPHLLAKSARAGRPAESLASHLEATLRAATTVRDRVGRIRVAEEVLGGQFWRAALLAALVHDAGKLADGFQHMLTTGQAWGQRHEVASLGFVAPLAPDPAVRRWIGSAVVTHHWPLNGGSRGSIIHQYGLDDVDTLRTELGAVSAADARTLMAWLAGRASVAGLAPGPLEGWADPIGAAHELLQQVLADWEEEVDDLDLSLAAVLLQGAVTLADHLSSAHGSLATEQPIGAGFDELVRQRVGGALRSHQRRAEQVAGHLLLRAPTGSGKTEAGLLWAARQVVAIAAATGGTPRVFFTLPYLASINAMVRRLEDDLLRREGTVGVAHSRAASYHLAVSLADEEKAARKALSRAAATRLFRETVRVGTPYQLLRGALAGAAHSGILADSANSVFVLDELHAYDARRLGYILAMARLWERLGGRVAVLSATLPDALVALICETLHGSTDLVEADDGDRGPARHRLRVRDRSLTDPESVVEIREQVEAGRAVLVVANNVAQAQELHAALAPVARGRYGPEAAILLHSRFKRGDRSAIEQRISDRYGTRAPRQPGLLVATQVVEVSLDVDFDVLFTSAAPLEALLQRFGRVNRLGTRPPADVIVHAPAYRTRRGDRDGGEYADGIYPREPVEHGWRILCGHTDQVVAEERATGWLDEIYASEWGEQWRREVRERRAAFEERFLRFDFPYDGRDHLAEVFDEMFEGTEAILAEDREFYEQALASAVREDGRPDRAAGKLLGEQCLIPLPHWAGKLAGWDRGLGVAVVDGEYHPERGLLAVHGPERAQEAYRPGEVL